MHQRKSVTGEGKRNNTSQSKFKIGVLTHHWVKNENLAKARRLLNGNGLAQSKIPGFISRQTLYSTTEQNKITTLVLWESNEIYDFWRSSPERALAMTGSTELWSNPPESERFRLDD